jgi:hypothetical protein
MRFYMSGSNASNIGYGNITPLSNINNNWVNANGSNDPAFFSNRVIPGGSPLMFVKNNMDAITQRVYSGGYFMNNLKRKIKNITEKYKMSFKHSKKKSNTNRKTKSRHLSGGKKHRKKRHTHTKKYRHLKKWRGGFANGFPSPAGVTSYPAGYGQYQNNLPSTPSYAVGGVLSSTDLGLANPPPISRMSNDNVDNYNHYLKTDYSSRGH